MTPRDHGHDRDDRRVDATTLHAWLDGGDPVWLVHAAGPESFRRAHLPGAICFAEVAQAAVVLRADDRVVVYGEGPDVREVARWATELRAHGFRRTWWLQEGLAGWQRLGGRVEGADA